MYAIYHDSRLGPPFASTPSTNPMFKQYLTLCLNMFKHSWMGIWDAATRWTTLQLKYGRWKMVSIRGLVKPPSPFKCFCHTLSLFFLLSFFPSAGFTPWPKDSHERGKGKGRVKEGKWKHRKGRGKGKGKEKERERGKGKENERGKKEKERNRRKRKRKEKGKEKERRRKRRRKRKSILTDTQLEPQFFPKFSLLTVRTSKNLHS